MMKQKTGAREAGWLLLALLIWLIIKSATGSEAALSTLSTVLIPIISFIGYAVGLKRWSLKMQEKGQ